MKRILGILFILSATQLFAGAGDTTHVIPHNKTYLNWYGDFNNWGVFPDSNKRYRKITLFYTLSCPSSKCTDYDYTQQIFVRRKGDTVAAPLNIEIARVITPFGGNISQAWSRTYRIDVTDYASLFVDSVEIGCHFEGYPQNNQGWLLTLDFEMIEGTPPRQAYKVENVWNGFFPYGKYVASLSGDTIEAHLTPKSIVIDSLSNATVLRIVPTGHGSGGTQNCAEFCLKRYYLRLNNAQIASKYIWRDDCGLNPTYPGTGAQALGTWLYDRANWCPGESVTRYDHDLSGYVNPGDTYTLNLDMDQGIAGNYTGYHYQSQLISYKDTSFSLDASVEDIIAPSKFGEYLRVNPTCGAPEIIIRNTGSEPLNSLQINYGVKGAAGQQQYTWTGNLGFMEAERVTLGQVDWQTPEASNYFNVSISNPNGASDQNPDNNTMQVRFDTVKIYPEQFIVSILTNNVPENSYRITDMDGNEHYANYLDQTGITYNDTVNLPAGCYKFELLDEGKDGLSYPFYGTGGAARFKKINKVGYWVNFNPNFGTSITHYFRTAPVSTFAGNEDEAVLQVYPNPAISFIRIEDITPGKYNKTLHLYSLSGQLILSQLLEGGQTAYKLELEGIAPGVYLLELKTEEQILRKKVTVVR